MAQSIYQSYHHLIFSTKSRYPFIKSDCNTELHKYCSGILRNLDSPCLCINSMPDHIHILYRQSKMKTAADLVYNVKTSSSKWMKTHQNIRKFSWQTGYACFSVNPGDINQVKSYIENQQKHHKKLSFREEVEQLMKEHGIEEYNAEHFWSS